MSTSGPETTKTAAPKSKTFTGGDQGWIDLKLEHVENVNKNVKKFRFALPNEDDVSGLPVACTSCCCSSCGDSLTDHAVAALLTKYKGPEMEKPVIRPYTPTSDEGSTPKLLIIRLY